MKIDGMVAAVKIRKVTLNFVHDASTQDAVLTIDGGHYGLGRKGLDKMIVALCEFRSELKRHDAIKQRQDAEIAAKKNDAPKK